MISVTPGRKTEVVKLGESQPRNLDNRTWVKHCCKLPLVSFIVKMVFLLARFLQLCPNMEKLQFEIKIKIRFEPFEKKEKNPNGEIKYLQFINH